MSLIVATCNMMSAQNYIVTDVSVDTKDKTAKTAGHKDLNGDVCGLLMVAAPEAIRSAEGNVVGEIEKSDGQSNIFMTKGSKNIVLNFDSNPSVEIQFPDWNVKKIESGKVYKITIEDFSENSAEALFAKVASLYDKKLYQACLNAVDKIINSKTNSSVYKTVAYALKASYFLDVEKNLNKALSILEGMTDLPGKELCIGTVLVRAGKISEGAEHLRKSADMGQLEALDALFKIYHGDINPQYKNDAKALECGIKMASHGNVDAQHFVACCYLGGIGTEVKLEECIEYFTMAASQGKVESQRMLGALYTFEKIRDLDKARKWLKMAAEQKDADAIALLNEIGWE